jgi:CheY-like chemotaxis protein
MAAKTDARRRHILLVEDNPGDVNAVREAMAALKVTAELEVLADGYAALDYLLRQPPFEDAPRPDLVLLDLNLPGLHGRQVLSAIKSDRVLSAIPVVMYSSAWAPEVIAECKPLADGFLVKPRTWAECVDRMREALRQLV